VLVYLKLLWKWRCTRPTTEYSQASATKARGENARGELETNAASNAFNEFL